MQTITEQRQEKHQFISTFGATYAFFFGEHPRTINVSAILLNSDNFPWESEWWYNYENYLRGTSLAERDLRMYLTYDDVSIEGYILNCMTTKDANDPQQVRLNFSMFVTHYDILDTIHRNTRRWTGGGEFMVDASSQDYDAIKDSKGRLIPATSTGAAVRKANLDALADGPGLLSAIKGAINSVSSFVDGTIQDARNFLYGRTLRVPIGFAGSEAVSGAPELAEGTYDLSQFSALNALGGKLTGSSILARIDAASSKTWTLEKAATLEGSRGGGFWGAFHLNYDEYVGGYPWPESHKAAQEDLRGVFQSGIALPPEILEEQQFYNKEAIDAFSQFGMNLVPPYSPEVARATQKAQKTQADILFVAGRVSFAALSLGAMAVSQAENERTSQFGETANNLPASVATQVL